MSSEIIVKKVRFPRRGKIPSSALDLASRFLYNLA